MVIIMSSGKSENFKHILEYLPASIASSLAGINESTVNNLCEIRLRASCPMVLIFADKMQFITESGRLTSFFGNDLITTDAECIKTVFNQMCRFSVYSLTDNITNGFITLSNGCRVGVYGTAITADGKINSVRNIKGLNIRISGRYDGVSSKLASIYEKKRANILICGPPSSGKTTVLKDLCRLLSDTLNYKIAAVDERGELSADYLGYNTDVLTEYPKASGIQIAVRTLSPDIVICDEVGKTEEVKSVIEGLNSGVSFAMSIHCNSEEELRKKEQYILLRESCCLDYIVFLKEKSMISQIFTAKELEDANCGVINSRDSGSTCRAVHSVFF